LTFVFFCSVHLTRYDSTQDEERKGSPAETQELRGHASSIRQVQANGCAVVHESLEAEAEKSLLRIGPSLTRDGLEVPGCCEHLGNKAQGQVQALL